MPGTLEDVFRTRTEQNRTGTINSDWNHTLLWRDLDRLIEEGVVAKVECTNDVESSFRKRQCFRDLVTGEVYIYIEGWERGSPEFRRAD